MKTPQVPAMDGMTPLGVKPEKETLILTLEHAKNPDIDDDRGGYWQEPVTPKKVTMEITNLRDAQSSFESWRDANGLGGGNMTPRSGRVTRKNGQLVGRFSYNGRFWNPEGKEVILGLCVAAAEESVQR